MRAWSAVIATCLLAACSVGDDLPEEPSIAFDFREGQQGWIPGFADYPVGDEANFELVADARALPAEAGPGDALFSSGNNHSDDLFMFWKRRVDGLIPGHLYRLRFGVEIATEAPHDCAGIGGAPGESVWLKAGASTIEPDRAADSEGIYRMNVDKGDQGSGGAQAILLDDIANGLACEDPPQFQLKSADSGDETVSVAADGAGGVWLFVGTDSGFEGTTRIFFTRFSVDVIP